MLRLDLRRQFMRLHAPMFARLSHIVVMSARFLKGKLGGKSKGKGQE
jgi:hypothetical protein